MGHQKVETTLIYAQLIDFAEDYWTARTARTIEDAEKLTEAGFEYVTDIEGTRALIKRLRLQKGCTFSVLIYSLGRIKIYYSPS